MEKYIINLKGDNFHLLENAGIAKTIRGARMSGIKGISRGPRWGWDWEGDWPDISHITIYLSIKGLKLLKKSKLEFVKIS